jgi:hypothetical protein
MTTGQKLYLKILEEIESSGQTRTAIAKKCNKSITTFNQNLQHIRIKEQTSLATLIELSDVFGKDLVISFEDRV